MTASFATPTTTKKPRNWRFFYRYVLTLLAVIAVYSAGASIFSALYWRGMYQRQLSAADRLRQLGVKVYSAPLPSGMMGYVAGRDAHCVICWVRFTKLSITPEVMECFHDMFTTRAVMFENCTIEGDPFSKIEDLRSLERVYFGNTNLSDQDLKHFRKIASLTELDMENTDVTAAGLDALAGMNNLELLSVRRCGKMTEEGLKHLTQLKGLTELEFVDVPISKKSLGILDAIAKDGRIKTIINKIPWEVRDELQSRAMERLGNSPP